MLLTRRAADELLLQLVPGFLIFYRTLFNRIAGPVQIVFTACAAHRSVVCWPAFLPCPC